MKYIILLYFIWLKHEVVDIDIIMIFFLIVKHKIIKLGGLSIKDASIISMAQYYKYIITLVK